MPQSKILERIKKNRMISEFLTPSSVSQIKRYLITGFSSAAIELTLLYILRDIMRLGIIEANSIALTIVFWFNFLMNRFFSFKSSGNIKKQIIMYGILFVFNLGASDLIMHLLTSSLHVQYLLAKVFAIGAVVSWNFILYKKVIYK
ncbi:MAG: GtrA family protein [Ruminiclostridium sp.]|nr:GtrA family protein [Ruminiclostridium sp.]